MDKTKLETELEFSEKKRSPSINKIVAVIVIIIMLAGLSFVLDLREALDEQGKKIERLNRQVEALQNDLARLRRSSLGEKQ